MAGQIKANQVQLGDSATATQNFTLQTNVDGTAKLARGNAGATTQDILTVDAAGVASLPAGRNLLTLATVQNTTSGTVIDFTNIPSWVKRITVMFNGVSTNGTTDILIQIGSGSIDATGYVSASSGIYSAVSTTQYTTGFGISEASAARTLYGDMTIKSMGGNVWCESGVFALGNAANTKTTAGGKTLSGALDRIRITTVNGTDTFDAGSVNIMYEG